MQGVVRGSAKWALVFLMAGFILLVSTLFLYRAAFFFISSDTLPAAFICSVGVVPLPRRKTRRRRRSDRRAAGAALVAAILAVCFPDELCDLGEDA